MSIKCFFRDRVLQILDGLTVNRTGIFHIKEAPSPALLRLYIDVAARLGVELAGMALPLMGDGPEDALSIRIDGEVAAGFCEIRLAGGGVCISASCQEDLERGTAYFATCYPYDGRDKSLQDHLEERALQCLTALTVDGKTLQVQEITGTSEGGTVTFPLAVRTGMNGEFLNLMNRQSIISSRIWMYALLQMKRRRPVLRRCSVQPCALPLKTTRPFRHMEFSRNSLAAEM